MVLSIMLVSYRESFPEGVSCSLLVNLTIDFFNTEPSVKDKLTKYREKMSLKAEVKMTLKGLTMIGIFRKGEQLLGKGIREELVLLKMLN